MPLDLAIPRADTCRTVQDAAGLLVELGDEIAFAPIVVGHVSAGRDLPGRQCEARLVPFDRQHDPQGAEPLAASSAHFLVCTDERRVGQRVGSTVRTRWTPAP